MTSEQSAAYVHAQVACVMAELFSMLAANTERQQRGLSPAYDEEAFMALQERYCVDHNAVIGIFQQAA